MKKLKRIVAAVMCATMLFNLSGVNVYATEEVTTQEFTVEDTTTEKDTTEESVDESLVGIEQETEVKTDVPLINCVIVGKNVVELGESQYVLVDMGADMNKMTEATITVANKKTGEIITKSYMDIVETVYIFELSASELTKSGEYEVLSIEFVSEGNSYFVSLEEAGIDARFGVNVEVDTDADLILTEEEVDQTEAEGIVVSDAEGNPLSAEDISQALSDEGDSLLKRRSNGDLVVVLDPGHGGSDSGTCHNGVVEKTANLKIAQYCKEELEKYIDVEVYMTRNSDVYVGLGERTAYAASVGADVFISIHNNYASSSSARGSEVYYPNANYNSAVHSTGKGLASSILNALTSIGLTRRGIYTRDYAPYNGASKYVYYPDGSVSDYYSVIRTSKEYGFPGLIIEHAFASNVADAALLTSESSLQAMGIADATAIADYFGLSDIEGVKYRGVDYSPVYDFDYYMEHNPDVKAAYGNNPEGAFRHFIRAGMKEGRKANLEFNIDYYQNRYLDLRNAYGDNLPEYYRHYCTGGRLEGRDATTPSNRVGKVTKMDGIDYSKVFDYDYYVGKYTDLIDSYGDNDIKALRHFITFGMREGRQAIESFNVFSYANRYSDLQKMYGSNLNDYYMHYMNYGYNEGRNATGSDSKTNFQSMYRLYNPNSGEHFYTANVDERDHLVSVGWRYENIAWVAPISGDPVYRLYNPNAGDHHYTLNVDERDYLVSVGWKYENIAWYSGGDVPLYRAYNPNAIAGAHHYTTSKEEINTIVDAGWKNEGIGWYGIN